MLFIGRIRCAMSPEEQFLAGLRLFDRVCRIMKGRIRNEFPDDEMLTQILKDQLALARRSKGIGRYVPAPAIEWKRDSNS